MSVENEKAHAFVQHLFSNPSLRQYTPLQREQQIKQFLDMNSQALLPTLTSGGFFPGQDWQRIVGVLMASTRQKTDMLFTVDIRDLISHKINFNFLKEFGVSTLNYDQVQEEMLGVINSMLASPRARQLLSGCYVAALHSLFNRYLQISYNRQTYVHFEFTKVQKLTVALEHLLDMMRVILLLMPAVWIIVEDEYSMSGDGGGDMAQVSLSPQLIERAVTYIKDRVTLIPEEIIRSAVNANVSFAENSSIEATSRVAAIFTARSKNYQSHQKTDRGAESPDKSWLYIARRNHKYYGFDSKMLEEFYSIASEGGW